MASFRNVKLKASGYAVDVSAEIAVQSALEAVRSEVGSPKVMVNCASSLAHRYANPRLARHRVRPRLHYSVNLRAPS